MYESPFDSNAPVPIMATRDGDSPTFNEARKGIDWIPWEDAMIKEIDGLGLTQPLGHHRRARARGLAADVERECTTRGRGRQRSLGSPQEARRRR